MKVKCKDDIVREFSVSRINDLTGKYMEACCLECGYRFGVHDTKVLKPEFKQHICKTEVKTKS
jgi:hypothetical protein